MRKFWSKDFNQSDSKFYNFRSHFHSYYAGFSVFPIFSLVTGEDCVKFHSITILLFAVISVVTKQNIRTKEYLTQYYGNSAVLPPSCKSTVIRRQLDNDLAYAIFGGGLRRIFQKSCTQNRKIVTRNENQYLDSFLLSQIEQFLFGQKHIFWFQIFNTVIWKFLTRWLIPLKTHENLNF